MDEQTYAACAAHAEMVEFLRASFPNATAGVNAPSTADKQLLQAMAVSITAGDMIARARSNGWTEIYQTAVARKEAADKLIEQSGGDRHAGVVFMGHYAPDLVSNLQAACNQARVAEFIDAAKQQTRLLILEGLSPRELAQPLTDWRTSRGPERVAALRRLLATELAVFLSRNAGSDGPAVERQAGAAKAAAMQDLQVAQFCAAIVHNRKRWQEQVAVWQQQHGIKTGRAIDPNLKII